MPSKLMGHLELVGELTRLFPSDTHVHVWADYIRTKFDLPEVFYFDL